MTVAPPTTSATRTRTVVLGWVRRVLAVLAVVALVDYVVLPHLAGSERSLHLLATIDPAWVLGGVLLETVSMLCYSLLTVRVLPGPRLPLGRVLRIDQAGLGLSHVLPTGAAGGTALRYRLLRDEGGTAEDTAVGLTVESVGSTLALLTLTWVGLVGVVATGGRLPGHLSVPLAGLVVVVTGVGVVRWASRRHGWPGQHRAARGTRRGRAPGRAARVSRALVPQRVRRLAAGLGQGFHADLVRLASDREALRASVVWAVGNWVFDAAALWVFLAAYGQHVNPTTLLVAYGLANTLGSIPVTPGGLGVVEGVLIPALIGAGVPSAEAVLGVVTWRLVNFWLPIPIGGGCFLSLWAGRRAARPGPTG